VRIFFATDVHGSEVCWKKFLNSGKHYKADVVILGGDMTGKALVPIIDDGGGRWHATLLENREDLNGEEDVARFEEAVKRRGYYPFRVAPDELRELAEDEPRWHALFEQHMLATVERWMEMADERLGGTGIRCFVCPGNDDQLEVDEVIANAKTVELGEGRVVEIDGYQMVSSGWANRTPWETYREEDEPDLAKRIEHMVARVTNPPERTIFSLHCPPYGTGLDDAGRLDRGPRRDRALSAGPVTAWSHPRGARHQAAGPYVVREPGQLLRAGPAARRGRRYRRGQAGQEVRTDKRLGVRAPTAVR
jgi:Icc-related predicted phosphoesterase